MSDYPELAEELLNSEQVFHGRVFTVTVDQVRLPSGAAAKREVIHHRKATAAVPLDAEGRVYLVRQWRHAVGEALLEIPAGVCQDGEALEDCLVRELAEEIDLVPGRIDRLVGLYPAPGFATEEIAIYLARDLRPESLPGDEDENLQLVRLPLAEALQACYDGRIRDSKSIAGLMLAAELLRKEEAV